MDFQLRFAFLLLLAPALLATQMEERPHLFLSFRALRKLDALSASRIESSDDATAYVREAAAQFGITDPSLIPDNLESRLATAELDAEKIPASLCPTSKSQRPSISCQRSFI